MATIDEETAKALLTGPLQLQRIYRAIEAARQEGFRTGVEAGTRWAFQDRGRTVIEACVKNALDNLGTIRALSPSGVEAGEGRTVEPEEAAAMLAMDDPGMCSHGELNYCHACKHEGVGYTRALSRVERELFEARSKHLTPPLVYWADIYMVLARLRGGSRG